MIDFRLPNQFLFMQVISVKPDEYSIWIGRDLWHRSENKLKHRKEEIFGAVGPSESQVASYVLANF